jgi:hypothetical protein
MGNDEGKPFTEFFFDWVLFGNNGTVLHDSIIGGLKFLN